ncbi:MAG: hypothetical protein LBP31_00625 [Holosporales bacterium]|nr:hypothetical protein [Holosporales bacterium]
MRYKAFDDKSRQIRLVIDGNYCQLLFDLAHDLNVARNKTDFGAAKMISRKILDLLDGNYTPAGGGAALIEVKRPQVGSDLEKQYQKLRLFVDLLLVQAAQILYINAIQEKTTSIMKTYLNGKSNDDIRKSKKEKDQAKKNLGKDNYEAIAKAQNKVGLDAPVNQFLSNVTKSASGTLRNNLLINFDEIFKCKRQEIKQKCMFAALLVNTTHVRKITETAIRILGLDELFTRFAPLTRNEVETAYKNAILEYIGKTFNFSKNNGLHIDIINMTCEYFMRFFYLAKKITSLNKKEKMPDMELIDSNGIDIFGNSNTCTFNSSFGSFGRNKGNQHLISIGGILTKEQQKDLYTEKRPLPQKKWQTTEVRDGKKYIVTYSSSPYESTSTIVPYRKYWFNGEEYKLQPKKEKFYDDEVCLRLLPMNDLPSRSRVGLAVVVYMVNQNESILKNKQFLKDKAQDWLVIGYNKESTEKMLSSPIAVYNHEFFPNANIPEQKLPLSDEVIALSILIKDYPSALMQTTRHYPEHRFNITYSQNSINEQLKCEKDEDAYRQMYASFGMNTMKYKDGAIGVMRQLNSRKFHNVLSMFSEEGPSQELFLQNVYISNPFASFNLITGFNDHARQAHLRN